MADLKRFESIHRSEDADRDSQAEALLVDGLDRYFAGQYEDAIHLWTRVLFLDRAHARARAYIERARTALAERQRRSEEMLQTSGELLAQGQTSEARDLLTRAIATSGDDEHAAALRLQLERIERVRATPIDRRVPAAVVDAVPIGSWWRRSPLLASAFVLTVMGAVAIGLGALGRDWLGGGTSVEDLTAVTSTVARPLLSSSEVALVRARTLYSQGRLAEALSVLDRVATDSTNRASADQLRVEIQQLLLATARRTSPVGRAESSSP